MNKETKELLGTIVFWVICLVAGILIGMNI